MNESKMITLSTVISMGWTKAMVTALLPEPKLVANPHYRKAAPMKLYREQDVLEVMEGEEYKQALEKANKRKISAQKATETKSERLKERMSEVGKTIEIKIMPVDEIISIVLNQKLQNVVPLAKKLFRLPYIMSAEEAVSIYRLPLYEKNMTALKSNQIVHAQEQFASAVVSEDNIKLGTLVSNETTKITIGCPEKSFTKHALVVGTPGSGKTTFSVNLLLQFARKGIPFLAIEPTKTEYRAMIDTIPNLQIFTPGNNSVSPYIINPFIPPRGIRVEQYIPSLASAFKAAFSMPSPLDMIFLKAIRTCYIKYGWKDYSKLGDDDVTLFGLHEFILEFKKLLENTNYSKEVRGNLESAGLLRLTNLIEQNSNIYDTINTVPIEDLLTAPTVLELNSIDNAEQKSLIMALLLINICIYTKHNHVGDGELKNAILIDEAHVLLGGGATTGADGSPDSQATTIKALQDMIAEIRSYGTSIIIADQSPTKVSREVVANTDIKVSFRLVQSVEKELMNVISHITMTLSKPSLR